MTAGLAIDTANEWLDQLVDPLYAWMHFDDPGAAGDANVALVDTREQVFFDAAADGVRVLTSPVAWSTPWSGGEQDISYVSIWTDPTAGVFKASIKLVEPITMIDGVIPRLQVLSLSIPSLAAD